MDTRSLGILVVFVTVAMCELDENNCLLRSMTYRTSFFNNKCYQFYYGTKTWKGARDYCFTNGGRLAKVDDPETQEFLRSELSSMRWNAEEMWIGMHDMTKELSWSWTAKPGGMDEPVSWTHWHEEHPEGWLHDYRDCVVMKKDGGAWTWHEAACNINIWSYRFICEHDPVPDDSNIKGNVDGVYQPPGVGVRTKPAGTPTRPPATSHDMATNNIMRSIRHGNGGNHQLSEEPHIWSENHLRGDLANLNGHVPKVGEAMGEDKKSDSVPIYAVIVSFGAGVLFVVIIIIVFVVLRRRRRKHKDAEPFPTVVYRSQPTAELGAASFAGGAMGGAVVACASGGRTCKLAVDMGKEKCVCGEEHESVSRSNRRSANIYVPIACGTAANEEVTVAADPDSCEPSTSAFSSAKDLSLFNEEPPTYDEAIAGIDRTNCQEDDRRENIYSSEPQNLNQIATQNAAAMASGSPRGKGAIPKSKTTTALPKVPQAPTETYLPMNGSPKLASQHQQNTDSNASQYTPMLGELPPIPTDQGYEIPVCTKLDPETVKSLRSPMEENPGLTSIYAEIPDRSSRVLKNEEQIYSTID